MKSVFVILDALIFSFYFLFLNPNEASGFSLRLVEKVKFGNNSELHIIPNSFEVTEDGLFLIPDYQEGDIKIFEKKGEFLNLVKKLGRKGFGSDEFNKPTYCFYDKHEGKFGVIDVGKQIRNVFIYDRINTIDFRRVNEIPNTDGYDIKLGGEGKQLIISGYVTDKDEKSYELYSINLKNPKQKDFLLPSYQKYHLDNNKEYEIEYVKNSTLKAIGIRAFIDVYGDDVYFVWEGKLRIIKINLKSKEKTYFGQRTPNYIEPFASKEFVEAYLDGDFTKVWQERMKMTFVRDIFATPRYVFIVYEGPGQYNFRIQMYSLGGNFLGDVEIPGNHYSNMWFDKDSYTLYSLSYIDNKEFQILILIMLMGITLSIYNYASSEKQTKGKSNSKDPVSEKSKKSVNKEPSRKNSKKPAYKKNIDDSSFHRGPESMERGGVTGGTIVLLPDGRIDCQGAPDNC
jgi:hypothetical protein